MVQTGPITENAVVIVFGASGDLAKKSTFPALYTLWEEGLLPEKTRIIGYARSKLSKEKLNDQLFWKIRDDAEQGHRKEDAKKMKEFEELVKYVQGSYDKDEAFLELEREIETIEKEVFSGAKSNRISYLALPPSSFAQVSAMIKKHNHTPNQINRLVIEKPFGKDTEDCKKMMQSIAKDWEEEEVYRIDHYLGEEMIREIYHLRFANSFVEPLLSNKYVEAVSVVMKETFGAEGRGGYFDEFGMIRDVGQNHLLQAIAIMMMDAPTSLTDDSLRSNKVDLLKAMPPVDPANLVLGQYAAAKTGPREDGTGKAYVDDETVPDGSKTATFAQWAMQVDNARWKGVPVLVKCGKALDKGLMEMTFHLRPPQNNIFDVPTHSNSLVIRMNPEPAVFFKANMLKPACRGTETTEEEIKWTVPGRKVAGDKLAYEVVLANIFKGDQSSFVREDEVIAAWEIFTPLLKHIEAPDGPSPTLYAYGTAGPEEQYDLEKKFGLLPTRES
ncbi:hypothetical protein QFC24_006448 [Naganishia onofrii]|uniref:Uncharacterized protein n=1 Tax=Naganishia onofrii TaxID=1851511 RepID=A0ACC2X008_9TREE|nr:hypothetical protein QFC24_006448 [Naganishia onofrii]